MILKEYINYEKEIESDFLSVKIFEDPIFNDNFFKNEKSNDLSLFLNIGNILEVFESNNTFYLNSKSGILYINREFNIDLTKLKNIKFIIIKFKRNLNSFLINMFKESFEEQYQHIFFNNSFLFNFPLNIENITYIEELFKINYEITSRLNNMNIKVVSSYLLLTILKKIINLDYKFLDTLVSFDTKYYATLKAIFDNNLSLEDALLLYSLDYESFINNFTKLNSSDFDSYITKFADKKIKNTIIIN